VTILDQPQSRAFRQELRLGLPRKPPRAAPPKPQGLGRSLTFRMPFSRSRGLTVTTDRVRARPAVTPNLSLMLGITAIGLGAWGALFPRSVARAFGSSAPPLAVQGLFGARELVTGFTLAADPTRADVLWTRAAGDAFDLVALCALHRRDNPRRGAVKAGLAFVLVAAALDVTAALRMSAVRRNG
jgi:hypothetical protein